MIDARHETSDSDSAEARVRSYGEIVAGLKKEAFE